MADDQAATGGNGEGKLWPPPKMQARLNDIEPQLLKLDREQITQLFGESLYSVGVSITRTIAALRVMIARGPDHPMAEDLIQVLLKADAEIRKLQGEE